MITVLEAWSHVPLSDGNHCRYVSVLNVSMSFIICFCLLHSMHSFFIDSDHISFTGASAGGGCILI